MYGRLAAVDRDLEGFGERLLDDPPRLRTGTTGGWTREWRFLIWTWTIRSGSSDWLVEIAQRRFLGEEAVRRISRTVWLPMAWMCVFFLVFMAVIYITLVYLLLNSSGADRLLSIEMILLTLPVVLAVATIVYFTFVPPKGYR